MYSTIFVGLDVHKKKIAVATVAATASASIQFYGTIANTPEAIRSMLRKLTSFEWRLIRYRNIIAILKNPFYAGVYTYGKSEKRTEIVDGRARKSYGHRKPMDAWEVFIKDHHEGYIGWAEYERNQAVLASNAYGKVGDTKSGRGGRALLAGLICCGRCGRKLKVTYNGRYPRPVYVCESPNLQLGHKRCFRMGGKHIDETIAAEMLHAVTPIAIEASKEAERMLRGSLRLSLTPALPSFEAVYAKLAPA